MRHLLVFPSLFLIFLCPLLSSAQSVVDSTALPQLHMLTYERVSSKHYHSWSLQYREFAKESPEFVIPVTLSFGSTSIDGNYLERKDVCEVGSYAMGFGFDGYEYLGSGLYFNLGLGVSPGVETVEWQSGGRDSRFLIGGTANLGLLYVPFPDFGLVIGLHTMGRLSNSSVLNRAIGLGIEFGFNF